MSEGVFDPTISLDEVSKLGNNLKEVIKPLEEINPIDSFPFSEIAEKKEYWKQTKYTLMKVSFTTPKSVKAAEVTMRT